MLRTMLRFFSVLVLITVSRTSSKIVDLTWTYQPETSNWPGTAKFVYTKEIGNSHERGYWYAVSEFCMNEHVGTHLDSPYHFAENGWKVADIPLDRLIANGTLLDLTNEDENTVLLPKHLDKWIAENGQFDTNTVLLVKFNWSQYFTDRKKYFGWNDSTIDTVNMNFPGISASAAQWIADDGNIVGVGLDTASVDPGNTSDYLTHRIFAKYGIYGLENVKLTETLPARNFTILVLPMKIKQGTGAPTRILALSNKDLKLTV